LQCSIDKYEMMEAVAKPQKDRASILCDGGYDKSCWGQSSSLKKYEMLILLVKNLFIKEW
jgi:hypothetical protein